MMKRTAAIAGILFALHVAQPPAAEACGVKLTIKTAAPKKRVAFHSSKPSSVLVIGSHSGKLQRELAAAGHEVEAVPTASAARKPAYAAVVTEEPDAEEARAKFGPSVVVVGSGNEPADVRTVESIVARAPVRARDREVVAARRAREPVAAGPTAEAKVVVAAKTDEQAPAPAPPPEPAISTTSAKPVREVAPAQEAAPKAVHVKGSELYFTVGGATLTASMTAQLTRTAKQIASSSVAVSIEGYADPSGNPDSNMTLSRSRAEAVRDFLVSAGIDASRLEVSAFGDTKLKYGGSDGRNRRVAIVPK